MNAADWLDINEAPRHAMLRLLVRGVQRMGEWSEARGCWVSAIDSRIRLRPTHYKEWPKGDAAAMDRQPGSEHASVEGASFVG